MAALALKGSLHIICLNFNRLRPFHQKADSREVVKYNL